MAAKFFALLFLTLLPLHAGEQQDVERLMHKYQVLFHMESWTLAIHVDTLEAIRTRMGPNEDGSPQLCVAVSQWTFDPEPRIGEIWVMRRSEYTRAFWQSFGYKRGGRRDARRDQRNSVVHEMVHNILAHANDEAAAQMLTGAINP